MAQKTHRLPSIESLFSESWDTFKKTWISLLVLHLIQFGVFVLMAIICVIAIILFSPWRMLLGTKITTIPPTLLTTAGTVIVVALLLLIFINAFFQAGSLLIIADKKKLSSLKPVLLASFAFILPLFFIKILTFFFVGGSFFLLIIPGIIVAIFLSFAAYEVVLGNTRGLAALIRSYTMFKHSFWELLGRVLFIWIISLIVNTALGYVGRNILSIRFIIFIVETIFSWFVLCYWVTLYKQAEKTVSKTEKERILPIVITAVLGWIIAAVLIFFLIRALPAIVKSVENNMMKHHSQDQKIQINPVTPRLENTLPIKTN